MYALKRKNANFPDIYFTILEAAQLLLNLLITRMPKQKTEELGSLSKSEKVRLNILYSRGGAAYGSNQNLSKPSSLSKTK